MAEFEDSKKHIHQTDDAMIELRIGNIHRDLDVIAAIAQLKSLFFEHLGYSAATGSIRAGGRAANAG